MKESSHSLTVASGDPSGPARGAGPRESLLAAAVYGAFLLLAVIAPYARGGSLFKEVIWDPIGLFSLYTGDVQGIRALQAGYPPLWDASRGLGSPGVISIGGTVDYPLKVLAYLLDSDLGWELVTLLRLWLAGCFAFLLARELPLRFPGALFAGLAYMLCGYFREFQNLPDLNITALVPLLMLFMVKAIRRPRMTAVLGAILVCHLLDASPESTFYMILYTGFFYLVGGVSKVRKRPDKVFAAAQFCAMYLMIAVSSFLVNSAALWQFVEYYHRAWHFHPATLGQVHVPVSAAIGLVTPLFDYWMVSLPNLSLEHLEQLTVVPAYLGAVTFLLATVALIHPRRLPPFGLSFAIAAVVLAGMIFGAPPFHLLLRLPLIRYFQNFRYTQPYLAHAVAMLAGMGLELCLRSPAVRKRGLVIAAAVGFWMLVHFFIFRHKIIHTPLVLLGLGLGTAAVIVIVGAAVVFWRRRPERRAGTVAGALIAAGGLELVIYFNLAVPLFGPNAFLIKSSPAVDFIQAQGGAPFRIWATDQRILHPNLAGLFGLTDLRDQTPLYLRDYVELMAAANGWKTEPQVVANFLAEGRFYFDLDWAKAPPRLLDLLNVRYVLAYDSPGAQPLLASLSAATFTAPAQNFVVPTETELAGVFRRAAIVHAPSAVALDVPAGTRGEVRLEAGILPRTAQCPDADGVSLAVIVKTEGSSNLVMAKTVAANDQGWLPTKFNLAGGESSLIMSSLPGPRNNLKCDYGIFSLPELIPPGRGPESLGLREVYDRELRIYENPSVLPRVFAVRQTAPAAGIPDFLTLLATTDPAEIAWLMGGELKTESLTAVAVSEIREGYGRFSFRTQAPGQGFVVISNHYFPGWRAWVDDEETRVYRVDGLLQGLSVPPGNHRVLAAYLPMSYRVGMWYHLCGLLIIGGVLIRISRTKARN